MINDDPGEMSLPNLEKYRIILASASPRRSYLLKGLDIDFEVKHVDIDETYPAGLKREEIALYLAEKKAGALSFKSLGNNSLLIAADTIVWIDERVVGKPENEEQAKEFLNILSGNKHEVITGVCIRTIQKKCCFYNLTNVFFKKLSPSEIQYYLKNYKPFDKAGSYGVQEWIGYVAVERIEGCFFNVMGLPVQQLYQELLQF